MTREEFIEHLRSGKPATLAVAEVTGFEPEVITIASFEDRQHFSRYAIMMAGKLMAALVILELEVKRVPPCFLDRIRAGEPAGAVLSGLERIGFVRAYPSAIRAGAFLVRNEIIIGRAQEIFTGSLFK